MILKQSLFEKANKFQIFWYRIKYTTDNAKRLFRELEVKALAIYFMFGIDYIPFMRENNIMGNF